MNKYHERWGQRTYLGILSGTDINGGILNAASSGSLNGHFSILGNEQ